MHDELSTYAGLLTKPELLNDYVQHLYRTWRKIDADVDTLADASDNRPAIMDALANVRVANELLCDIATEILELAAHETTIPASQLAAALGVPASTLRGLRPKRRVAA